MVFITNNICVAMVWDIAIFNMSPGDVSELYSTPSIYGCNLLKY